MQTTEEIEKLIEAGNFSQALEYCDKFPDEIRKVDPLTGMTVLHMVCQKPPAPMELLQKVLKLFPDAVRLQEKRFQATPLHILAWTSQRTSRKVRLLLEFMKPEDLCIRNQFGGTALHSACGSQATIDVIKLIYGKNPAIVSMRTFKYNHTALTALWQSHLQSIQGHMQIARILQGREVNEGHFDRFWEKVQFIARRAFEQSDICGTDMNLDSACCAFHGLLELRAPINALKVAVKRHPEWACHRDVNGNLPLHSVVERRPFRLKDNEIIQELIKAFPEGASAKNSAGDTPLFLGIRGRMTWEEGLGSIADAGADVLGELDVQTRLYPFLLAASMSGRVAVNTAYCLLTLKPHLVKDAL